MRPRFLLKGFLVITMLLCTTHTWAYDFEVDGIYYRILSSTDKTCAVTYRSYMSATSKYSGKISIPETANNYTVVSIDRYAFYCCTLTAVTIPSTVTSIGDYAFFDCTKLVDVSLSEGVSSIGEKAFSNCLTLQEITLSSNVTELGEGAFYYCPKLKTLTIADGNKALSFATSADCDIFHGCPLQTLYIGRDITYNDTYSPFRERETLTSLTLGKNMTSIGDYAFYQCTGLTGELNIPDGVVTIGDEAFAECSGLTGELKIPDSVTTIGYSTFVMCTGLTSVTIGDGVTTIGEGAFACCYDMGTLNLGNSVTTIGTYAFQYCDGLIGELKIPDSVTTIGFSAFNGCAGLTSLTIGEGVTTIGDLAFYNCSGLTGELKIPDGVIEMGNQVFSYCSSLTSVTIGEGITTIGSLAFMFCRKISLLTLGSGVTAINGGAFASCSNLSEVYSLNPEPPELDGNVFSNVNTENCRLIVPDGSKTKYATADQWKDFYIVEVGDIPTVTTLEATDITYSSATLNGSVAIGNEDILMVGFEYWTNGGITRSLTASNNEGMFSATLKNILNDTSKYYYRAYAETDSGIYYGNEMSFTTDDTNGIDGIATDGAEIIGYYSTDGQQITSPTKGVNIVKYSDGTTKKVLVK